MGDTPFFTSDYPVAIERRKDGNNNRLLPLAPDICLRIIPDVRLSDTEPDLTFPTFSSRRRKPMHGEIVEVNRLIVQCAEDLVFYRDDLPWIERFVRKHKDFRIEPITRRIPKGTGFLNWSSQQVAKKAAA